MTCALRRFALTVVGFAVSILAPLGQPAARAADWLYLDLGEVVVTGNPTSGYTLVPGAREWILEQRAAGRNVALLSNIPEAWGPTCGEKFGQLQRFLGARMSQPFDWSMFDAVVLPPFDRYRKPAPLIFVSALAKACPSRAAFIGEDAEEVAAAAALGFATHHKVSGVDLPTGAELESMLSTFAHVHPDGCDFAAELAAAKLPEDAGVDVEACVLLP